ncbi:eukaryotic translation initiation factor 3 subunit A [Exophiala dermatitidis]|uniref:Eukaryotic translation initiation factor 3 subunit A n=2 Tax=Exophiala dermatitidis TaxID=5970 RepID=H6BRG4_EXODN|nr:translation initiation factor eIF-3 subunit 10 [Exophiala dermatitidis NIH/UT8656]KAJ4515679.1 eukaryotic translation initiation factor 3 subunit A [Exophiala dermatitidis]EHY53969.1 translation initiation factor eIF-3 subunit 10 [Exophiala dermatitidis NIH/UT8656]KAJ4519363.1 eukaryotic translation initiation factor 3 subunit A [Exophiala dermatitidis]KAJ4529179.1 eukaryotic translation initiation factor 3 subunit A [Exophiala dermatitidis]KAJ4544176.1 eukaryotic translation initiation fac
MPPPPHIRPENVLRRAQELIAVDQPQAALNVLHEHVTSKRSRNSAISSLEPVMLLFVELCVDLRKGKAAKDGLYQYKNIAQNTNVGTIELVLKRFIELAEQKVQEAQAKADQVQSSLESAASSTNLNIEDLEATETPETILLATVSGEQSKDRTDRAIVTPWLKFLWETYRTVLEILKNNARLEVMYQSTAHQAFDFCLKYTRKTEFRRLCELLRNHVQNAAKYSSQMHAINLSEPDTLQRHLETRFRQLNVADELELWQEAFRSVEDIHMLLTLSKRPAKNVMMANYYEKLTKIFLVSDNFLFHAAAYNKYYNLLRQSASAVAAGQTPKRDNPVVTEEALTKAASFVLLSALAIPVISTSRSRGVLVDVDEARKNKNNRLTNLLSMPSAPTRAALFKDILNKGLLKRARPEIRDLYNILEVDFHPLSICKKISPILAQIGADPEMEKYVLPLQQVILTRLFQQLSQVYETVELSFVNRLAQFPAPFEVTPAMIEKFIMNGCKKGDLSIRLDHVSGILSFDSDVFSSAKALHPGSGAGSAESETGSVQRLQNTPAEIARLQLTRLAKTLHITCMYVDPSYNQARLAARESALARAQAGAQQEHEQTLERRVIIEKQKEAFSEALSKKQREEETRRRIRAQQQAEAESARLREETRARELKRVKDEQARIRRQEVEKQLEELKGGMKIDLEDINVDELDSNAIRMLKLTQLEKDKHEKDNRIRITAKRIDHLERAFRREELKYRDDDYAKQREEDLKIYEQMKQDKLKEAEMKHKEGLALKHRLSRLVKPYDSFKGQITERRAAEFERLRKRAEREFEEEKRKRIKAYHEELIRQRQEKEEEERRAREEEERRQREEEERAKAEEEKKRIAAERRAKAEADRLEREEIARKQMQREEEAIARRAARKAAPAESQPFSRPREAVPMDSRTESSEGRTAPRLNLQPPRRPGGYVPPALREGAGHKSPEPHAAVPAAAPAAQEPAQAPSRRPGGYVPPHLREGAAPRAEAPPRDLPTRDLPVRNSSASPANGVSGGRYVPTHLRDSGRSLSREGAGSPAAGNGDEAPRKPATGGSGRYVPPSMRNRQ